MVHSDATDSLIRCAYRHLAIAAAQLAQAEALAIEVPRRYAAAAAIFRDLSEQACPESGAAPFVMTASGLRIGVADLFATAYLHSGARITHKRIDQELVNEAVELLSGLKWTVPSSTPVPPVASGTEK